MNLGTIIIKALWLFLPAGIANLVPPLVKKIDFLDLPINSKLFGKHKTYRGFLFGLLAAILTTWIQQQADSSYNLINYDGQVVTIGFLMGFGALFGDLVKSYFKRRFNIKPGQSWLFFDQTDWIISAILFSLPLGVFEYQIYLTGLISYGFAHIIVNYLGYLLKINKQPI